MIGQKFFDIPQQWTMPQACLFYRKLRRFLRRDERSQLPPDYQLSASAPLALALLMRDHNRRLTHIWEPQALREDENRMISILMLALPVRNRYIPEHRYRAFTLVSQLCYPGGLQSTYQLTR